MVSVTNVIMRVEDAGLFGLTNSLMLPFFFFFFKMRLLSPSGVFLEYRQVWLVGLVCLMIAALALVIIAKQKEIILLLKDHATLKRNLTP